MVYYKSSLVALLHLLGCSLKILAISTLSCDSRFDKNYDQDYVCPKEKCSSNKVVFGTYSYTSDSRVCRAAWHDGRILPWSDNDADRTVRWTTCTKRSGYLLSYRYRAGRTTGYATSWDCNKFVSARKFEPLYRLSTLSSMGSGTVRVYGGSNVDLATDVLSASVYDTTVSTSSPPTEVLSSNALKYKEYRIHTGVNVFTTTGNKENLYSRIVNINYAFPDENLNEEDHQHGYVTLSGAEQSSTLRLVNSTSLNWTADAGKAIDGSRSTDFMNGKSCSHTLKRDNLQNPWLRVALNRMYIVHGIEVTSRNGSHDCKKTQLGKDYIGTVSKDNKGYICRKWTYDKRWPHLHVLENYCRNPDNEPRGPWCSHARGVWRYCDVSLCSDLTESLRDFQVLVSNASETLPATSTDVLCKHYTGTISDATTVYIACDRPVTGRYLYIIKNGNSKSETLSLCEVGVTGIPISTASSTLTTRVSVGDRVTLTFDGIESSGIRWQKDSAAFYKSGDINGWNDKLTNTIDPVEVGHGGVYTIYISHGNVLGITRLVVRVCPSGKYGIDCTDDCPHCENGGICHDITGECICPPGFTGRSCSTGCGGNLFGSDCLSKCSEVDREDGCQGKYVCTIDPYGCSCVTGFKGMTCSEECQDGYYGADCQQACGHCINNAICNPYTGHCRDSCAPGYMTFPYCQTECPAGSNGSNCQQTCGHCVNGAAWTRHNGAVAYLGYHKSAPTFCLVDNCAKSDKCREIARLKDPPTVVLRLRTTLSARWTAWRSGTDHGVGPLEKYVVEYRQSAGGLWTSKEVSNVANKATFNYNISSTDVSHVYLVRIRIKVAGGLLGNSSPEAEACGEPPAPEPSLSNTEVNTLGINWPETEWRCGTPGWYVVEYINGTDATLKKTSNITSRGTSLYTASCTTWRVRVRTFNKHMSSLSGEKIITSQNKAPSNVKDLVVVTESATSTSLTVAWKKPQSNGCPIEEYRLTYRLVKVLQCTVGYSGNEVTEILRTTRKDITGLKPYSKYELKVAAKTKSMGEERLINGNTLEYAPSGKDSVNSDTEGTRSVSNTVSELNCQDRNGVISHYEYMISNDRTTCSSASVNKSGTFTELQTDITGLVPSNSFTVRVRAHTAADAGPWSDVKFATREEVLTSVSSLNITQVNSTLKVKWTAPPDDGCQLQSYEWRYQLMSQGQCDGSQAPPMNWTSIDDEITSVVIPNVSAYSTYNISVRPKGPSKYGLVKNLSTTTSQQAPSAPPQNSNVVTRNTSLSFSWREVECVKRNGEVNSYRYQIRNDKDLCVLAKDFVNETVSHEVTFRKLTPYTRYVFRVQAMVGELAGPWTAWTSVTTNQSVPPAPSDVKVLDKNPKAFKLSWNAPCPLRGKILLYFVSYQITNQSGNGICEMPEKSAGCGNKTCENCTETTLQSLRPDARYIFRVKAQTVGWGEWSNTIEETTNELAPGEPASLTCLTPLKQSSISLKWSEPLVTNGKITNYTVQLQLQQKRQPTKNLSADLSDLTAGRSYKIFVFAFTSVGEGPPAGITCWTSLPDIPKIHVPKIKEDDMTDHSVKVQLVPPSDYPNVHDIKFYLIVVERMNLLPMRRRRSVNLDSGSLKGYSDSAQKYIAANITTLEGELSFVIGDGQESNGCRNQELKTGKQYRFIFGFFIENGGDKKEHYQYIPFEGVAEEEAFTVKNWKKERENTTIGAVIGSVAAIIFVMAIAGFVFYRRRRVNKKPSSEELVMDDISAIENTSSPKSNKYEEAAQGPVVRTKKKPVSPSKPISPTPPAEPVYSNFTKPISVNELDSYVAKRLSDGDLAEEYKSLPSGLIFSRSVALKDDNKKKNRFTNILPYNKNRVILEKIPSEPNSDYINASYIDGYKKPRAFIAAMGPNRHTVKDFWRMVWQENVNRIVMLTNPVESRKRKCEVYWPDSHEVERYGDINVTLTGKETKPDYVARTFEVLKVTTPKQNQARELVHYHFTSWADHDVPKSSALWKFYRMVKGRISRDGDKRPTVVHCSAGVGRTGTFIMMDILSEQIQAENVVDILGQLYLLRQQRVNMVQTWSQYEFIHVAMVENIYGGDTFIPSKDYENALSELFTEEQTKRVNTPQEEFQTLRRLCPPCDPEEYGAGRLPQNTNKNRFPKILPLSRARPYLMTPGEEGGTDYINAVFINGFQHRDAFIVTQMPLPNTVLDFWRMIYDHDSSTIVMLNASADGDKTCARYWAEEGAVKYGHFRIETAAKRFQHNELIIHRTFNIVDTKKTSSPPRQIKHFELTNWPKNQKIPPSATQPALIELYDLVQNRQRKTESKPVTVHCLDGCLRSGFFCSMANLFDKIKIEQGVDVFQTVKSARLNRPEFVPEIEQYKSLYLMAQRFLESFETYANFQ